MASDFDFINSDSPTPPTYVGLSERHADIGWRGAKTNQCALTIHDTRSKCRISNTAANRKKRAASSLISILLASMIKKT